MTMKTIQIICTSPGMRRNGMRHPASAFYPADRWGEEELAAFRRDPNFVVREVDEHENLQTDADFEIRVKAEVDAVLMVQSEALQASFAAAVADASAGKIAELQSKIDDLEGRLQAAMKAGEKAGEKAAAKK